MLTASSPEIRRAVSDVVNLVNLNSGRTCVRLRYSDEPSELDFVANSAEFDGDHFVFTAGIETYGGTIEDLTRIRAEVISGKPS